MPRPFKLPSTTGTRDLSHRATIYGMIVPAVLTVWAAVNIVTGQAMWPVTRGRSFTLVWVDDWLKVLMAGCVKLGIAIACFGWYFMANRDDWSYWCQPVTVLGSSLAVAAFVVGALSFVS